MDNELPPLRTYKFVLFSQGVKYTFKGKFDTMRDGIRYYENHYDGEVIEAKALNVRIK